MSDQRREDFIEAARQLYEEQGLSRTSVQSITDRLGVTRTLFYHYFPDKEAVTSAVLDAYVADYIEALEYWNEQRRPGNIEHALESVVKILRLGVFENDAFRRSLASEENAALYLEFVNRVADRVASYMLDTTVRDYGRLHTIKVDHVYETFYMLVLGIVGYVRHHPEADDEVLKDLIAQTLHIVRGTEVPPERPHGEDAGSI
ncbi:TetR/AcrR family transcriptional regulator [Gordonibacter sp. 28C]|uniref:TetR/AcrR family transcriptional regulator n=1 Tax=Gordonibacter sp. 28C TaxID=2078569 RepID=UPI000DF7B4F9|nr:TetR/AcrR family transcriptional regulator [Gordonibacter sp. 28C]RDB61745.1 TetR/AcrR family transcriptional regulator [Gordonibacter sp. 28C]